MTEYRYNSHHLRAAVDGVVVHLANLHTNHVAASQLAAAISDLISIQDSVNAAFSNALHSERRQRLRLEERFTVLESSISAPGARRRVAHDSQTVEAVNVNVDLVYSESNSDAYENQAAQNSLAQSHNHPPVLTDQQADDVQVGNRNHSNHCEKQNVHVDDDININMNSRVEQQLKSVRQTHVKPKQPRQRHKSDKLREQNRGRTMAGPSSRKRTNRAAMLPTVEEVQAGLDAEAEIVRKRRKEARREPPPCAKCRVRKRADMLRDLGRVDEEIFERWARRPGGCLGFMHMHDKPAERSALTFTETATQPP